MPIRPQLAHCATPSSNRLGAMVLGPLLPGICILLAVVGYARIATTVAALVGASMYFAAHSPRWCRFYLKVIHGDQ